MAVETKLHPESDFPTSRVREVYSLLKQQANKEFLEALADLLGNLEPSKQIQINRLTCQYLEPHDFCRDITGKKNPTDKETLLVRYACAILLEYLPIPKITSGS